MNVVDPRGLTISEWCDYTSDNLSSLAQVMKVSSDDEWRQLADYLLSQLRRRVQVPDQRHFSSFMDWAMRFNQVIATLEI